jgi:outer membrane lipoprotein SlyB
MADIIAGRFQTEDEARSAAASLVDLVNKNDISIFFNNQPGAHDSDRDAESSGDQEAGKGAAAGAISGGVVAGTLGTLIGGPAVGAVTAAVGAYTGSLVGTAGGLAEEEGMNKAPHPRPAGVMLAVRVANTDDTQRIIERLRQHGAVDIEKAKGNWVNGAWVNFDPTASPQLVY